MKKPALLILIVVACVSGGRVLNAVTFGEPDGTRHPYVGTMILRTASGFFRCSGTLLSPTVFLTAGHCTSEGGVVNLATWVKFTPSISFAGLENYPFLEAYLDDPVNGWVRGDAVPHPLYDDFAGFPATYDIGVVLLHQAVVMSTYGTLPPENFLQSIRRAAQDRFTVVGYGDQGVIRPFASSIWARYQGQVRLIELNSTFNAGMSAKFSSNAGIGGGACFGDSGGPVLYANTNMVVATVSFGHKQCMGVDYQFRTDTALALSFLQQYVP